MKTKDLILKQANLKGFIKSSDIVRLTKISRQTIAEHFRKLIAEKKLIKTGSTHNARYIPYKKGMKFPAEPVFHREYSVNRLSEDKVFQEASLKMNLKKELSYNGYKIANYAFTEMLNNAIDHSRSKNVRVWLKCVGNKFEFEVLDRGIGIFENIRKKFKLKDHYEAIEHLLKGKQTTDEKRHSGQGIFFTSKIADVFIIESAKIKLVIDNLLHDTFVKNIKSLNGTRVRFSASKRTRKELEVLFKEYQNSNFEFDKTKLQVSISLSGKSGDYVSRSEAKRLLYGLDRFKRIILNFNKVKTIGQGFADEIFRIYKSTHPKIRIEALNMSPAVEFMIKRVKK